MRFWILLDQKNARKLLRINLHTKFSVALGEIVIRKQKSETFHLDDYENVLKVRSCMINETNLSLEASGSSEIEAVLKNFFISTLSSQNCKHNHLTVFLMMYKCMNVYDL